MSQYYGVLRVVRVRLTANTTQDKYPAGWLPEERLVHLLTRQETLIGRALNNDLVLMDPTVSREHARLVYSEQGWRVFNLTSQNVVRVNSQPVPAGGSLAIVPQDLLVIGNTTLQLIARQPASGDEQDEGKELLDFYEQEIVAPSLDRAISNGHIAQAAANGTAASNGRKPEPVSGPLVDISAASSEDWNGPSADRLLDMGVTMQFAFPQPLGKRKRWLIAGLVLAVLLVGVIVTFALNSLIGLSQITRSGVSNVLLALTIPLIPALSINLLVNFIDRFEREPWFLRMAAFLWGAIIAIPTALLIEQKIDLAMLNALGSDDLVRSLFKGLNAGITEETVKGLGLLLLFLVLRDEFDNVTDGIVYGALIGAGFAMVENFVYFVQYSKDFLLFLIVGRVVLGWLCHSTFTVCFGAALGYVRHTRVRWRQIVFPLLGYLCAVGLHSVFDFINFFANAMVFAYPENATVSMVSLIAIIGNYIPPFIAQVILLYFLIKALVHEGAVIREFLASEVSSGVVMVDEYALLQNSFQRTRAERRVLWKYGVKQWLRVRALYQTEIGLAFRKWHVSMGDKPKLGYVQPEDAYRQRIKRLRREIVRCEQQRRQSS